jgi:3'5'-cyclic nucleotide phosphodiesterase/Adenylate and Guanylate cyclase catalytic domain
MTARLPRLCCPPATVNTAARMESNGLKERIHVSQETADLIQAADKGHWLTAREDKIHAKGKGELQTYWLEIRRDNNASGTLSDNESESSDYSDEFTEEASSVEEDIDGEIVLDEKSQRLVDWTVDQLSRLLKQILARRKLLGIEADPEVAHRQVLDFSQGGTVIDEVRDIVRLVPFNPKAANLEGMVDSVTLSAEVVSQLRDFVATIATLHNSNQFHNLSHATHVTMSVVKLLSRIIAADDPRTHYNGDGGSDDSEMTQEAIDMRLHEQSYGIRSDPLAQFAVVFSALIHDVDHPGVTNAELIKEGAKIADTYNSKSISEQNSVDLAWYLFMDERYGDLRGTIYHDEAELMRFRQLIVNVSASCVTLMYHSMCN